MLKRFLKQRKESKYWGVLTFPPLTIFNPTRPSTSLPLLHCAMRSGTQTMAQFMSRRKQVPRPGSRSLSQLPPFLLSVSCYWPLTWSCQATAYHTASTQFFSSFLEIAAACSIVFLLPSESNLPLFLISL